MATRATMSPRRARRSLAAKSSEAGDGGSFPAISARAVSVEAVVVMDAIGFLVCLRDCRIGLHYEIARGARYAVFVGAVVDHGNVTAEIIVRRWSRGSPLEGCGFPGIVTGFLAVLHAPEKIEQENELAGDGNERGVGHECLQPNQV